MIFIILSIIEKIGYLGIFILMVAESTILPVPSEAVLPFAGYLVGEAKLNFWLVLSVATIGTTTGSLISYHIGKKAGRWIIEKHGKYFLLDTNHLSIAEKWFLNHGSKTIFICRFVPAIRHVISIPAGVAKMNLKKFVTYTTIGGLIWNAILICAGMQLQKNWETILKYTQWIDLIIITILIALVIIFLKKKMKKIISQDQNGQKQRLSVKRKIKSKVLAPQKNNLIQKKACLTNFNFFYNQLTNKNKKKRDTFQKVNNKNYNSNSNKQTGFLNPKASITSLRTSPMNPFLLPIIISAEFSLKNGNCFLFTLCFAPR